MQRLGFRKPPPTLLQSYAHATFLEQLPSPVLPRTRPRNELRASLAPLLDISASLASAIAAKRSLNKDGRSYASSGTGGGASRADHLRWTLS
jgi:hypothetical protein